MMERSTHTEIVDGVSRGGIPAFKLIEDRLNQVKELINKQLAVTACPRVSRRKAGRRAKTDDIRQLLEHINARSGKMLRPGLVLLAGGAVGEITDEHMQVAAIVEMIHNASLLHDDVIYVVKKRRGMPTINKLWGNESAVILGDFLLSRVFKRCSDLEPKVINMIAAAAARTCDGELRQVIQRHNWRLSEPEYIDIISEKSAAFFSSCCGVGALLAQGSDAQVQSLERFGLNAGIAFQITDDLLDLTGDESQTGKTTGSDANKNKLTLAVIHLLRVADDKAGKLVVRASTELSRMSLSNPKAAGANKQELLKMLRSHGSLEYAHSRAKEFLDKAMQALTGLEESEAKTALIETAKFMATRTI
jgi:octaprenyl-diphosphate synthase